MNILIPLLRESRGLVADLMPNRERGPDRDRLALGELLASGAVEVPARIREQQDSPDLRRALSQGYLPVLDESQWDRAVDGTRTRPLVDTHRWVTFVPVSPDRGLSAPDDDSPEEEVTTFVDRPGGITTTMSIPLTGPPVVVMREGGHCPLPSRGQCARGCGSCALHEVLGPRSGLVCLCDHDEQAG